MRAWERFKALDEGQGPLKFKVLFGEKRFVLLLAWKTKDKYWQDAQPLRSVEKLDT